MRKIKIGSKYWALKFFSALIVVSLLGTLLIEGLCVLFGTAEVFLVCCAIVLGVGLSISCYQLTQKLTNTHKNKEL